MRQQKEKYERSNTRFKRDKFCCCFPLESSIRLIGLCVVLDFANFIYNCWDFYTNNWIDSRSEIVFLVLYCLCNIFYPYVMITMFVFGTRCMPDNLKNRLVLRRCCLCIMISQVLILCLLTFAYFEDEEDGWMRSL